MNPSGEKLHLNEINIISSNKKRNEMNKLNQKQNLHLCKNKPPRISPKKKKKKKKKKLMS